MSTHQPDSAPPEESALALKSRQRREHELELELRRIRSEASAARLEARAVELELTLRRLRAGTDHAVPQSEPGPHDALAAEAPPEVGTATGVDAPPLASARTPSFQSWGEVRRAIGLRPGGGGETGPIDPFRPLKAPESSPTIDSRASSRGSHESVRAATEEHDPTKNPCGSGVVDDEAPLAVEDSPGALLKTADSSIVLDEVASLSDDAVRSDPALPDGPDTGAIQPSADPEGPGRQRKPAAWLLSGVAHGLLIALLAFWTLSVQRPADQVTLSASPASAQPETLETVTIESPEPPSETLQEPATDTEVELADNGTSPIADFTPEPLAAAAAPIDSNLFTSSAIGETLAGSSHAEAVTEFCGVAGGGNHFVYLVDSSGSMGDAFTSARLELIRSIETLQPDQRFYVVFFDAEPDYMRLSDPGTNEPQSVPATAENKRRLREWALSIGMNRGRAPYEPLRFALGLRPDVIFLLSDGEFPQSIEELLREENRFDNLFGDSGTRCIVHTIGYHSREGESRMRRIAEQNGGRYRHVPDPGGPRR
jgi:hypothetical protein